MKLTITNTVALNGGDAAILMAIIALVRSQFGAEAEIVVFDSQPEAAAKYYPGTEFRGFLFPRLGRGLRRRVNTARVLSSARLLRAGFPRTARLLCPTPLWGDLCVYFESDAVISTGGTYLVEHYDLSGRLFDFELTQTVGTSLSLYTQSLGPFRDSVLGDRLKRILNNATVVLVRDEKSVRHLDEIGVAGESVKVSADAAFALADESTLAAAADRVTDPNDLRVAISVRHWQHFGRSDPELGMPQYLQAIADLVDHLVNVKKARVILVSSCQGIPEYWTDDSKTAAKVLELLSDHTRQRVTLDRSFHSPNDLMTLLGEQDLVVATRMHVAILALCAGTLVVPIAYEFKTKELFARLGAAKYVRDIESVDGAKLVETVDRALEHSATDRSELFQKVSEERDRALESVAWLAERLRSTSA